MRNPSKIMRAVVIAAGAAVAAGVFLIASPAYADDSGTPDPNAGGCSTQALGSVATSPGQLTSGTFGGALPADTPNGGIGIGFSPSGQPNVALCLNGNWTTISQTAPPPSVVNTINTAVSNVLKARNDTAGNLIGNIR
jgi:hypothetical protein